MQQWTSIEAAALTLGFKPEFYDVGKSAELNTTFAAILRERPDASFVIPDPFIYTQRARIIDLALTNRIPTIYGLKEYARDGGLVAVGPNRDDMARRAAALVDKILKGAKPADIPVEQPTRFELVVNLKTAKALGLTIPQSILGLLGALRLGRSGVRHIHKTAFPFTHQAQCLGNLKCP
jgi:putative tryptophan/tyrosine transport system substrate-binding protein